MSQTSTKTGAETKMPPKEVARTAILQGDRSYRHFLRGDFGNFLAVSDDIYRSYCFVEPVRKALEESHERQQQLHEEIQRLLLIVDDWVQDHESQIDKDKTRFLPSPLCSSTGKVRFQFLVIPQAGQEGTLEEELVNLDRLFLDDTAFQIVRLDSVLL